MAPKSVLKAGYDGLFALLGAVVGFAIAAMALLITLDVLLRNAGLGNLPWLNEVAEYALYAGTFLAAPWALRQGAHVRVDLLISSVPPAVARVMELLVDAIGAAISGVLLYYGLNAAIGAYLQGSVQYKTLAVPEWWLLSAIPLSALLLAAEFCLRFSRVASTGAQDPGASSQTGL